MPIFRKEDFDRVCFYAPGYLAVVETQQASRFEDALIAGRTSPWKAANDLRRHAAHALEAWSDLHERPFAPVCLTLYLNERCELACRYCFSNPSRTAQPEAGLSSAAVSAAAHLVARNCLIAGVPLVVAFHGGGEPAIDLADMQRLLKIIESVARAHHLPLFRYIATGGVVPQENIHWLARHFDLVGLSCDGPPFIQARQRPLRSGGDSSGYVVRAAEIIHAAGKPLHVRVTITPDSIRYQSEIAEYICRQLHPQEIHVEPAYHGGRAGRAMALTVQQASDFVAHFFEARAVAQAYGIAWRCSASRPGEIHGPYCNIFRQVLHLLPGDGATACFKMNNTTVARTSGLLIGEPDRAPGTYELDASQIQQQRSLLAFDPQCKTCFNCFHCTRLCPDDCLLIPGAVSSSSRCHLHKLLAERLIDATARIILDQPAIQGVVSGECTA